MYAALCLIASALFFLRGTLFAVQAVRSSKHLHTVLTDGVLRAPVPFFDLTPVGRILNRFTKDMDSVDLLLPKNVPQVKRRSHTVAGSRCLGAKPVCARARVAVSRRVHS